MGLELPTKNLVLEYKINVRPANQIRTERIRPNTHQRSYLEIQFLAGQAYLRLVTIESNGRFKVHR